MRLEEIEAEIKRGIAGCEVSVAGDGRHFQVTVISEAFAGKSPVQQHQLVYQCLGGKVGGEIHALSIDTYTPAQWQQRQASPLGS